MHYSSGNHRQGKGRSLQKSYCLNSLLYESASEEQQLAFLQRQLEAIESVKTDVNNAFESRILSLKNKIKELEEKLYKLQKIN